MTLAESLMRGKMRELFCSGTTIAPDAVTAGKIIVVDLPLKEEWGEVGRVAAVLWKYCLQGRASSAEGSATKTAEGDRG